MSFSKRGGGKIAQEGKTIIIEGEAWKRRSGLGKYDQLLGGKSWEKRHLVLTATQLYYTALDDTEPRQVLNVLSEKATVMSTYSDTSHPTPYCLSIRTIDSLSQTETTKWKLCFEDRATLGLWLVALTDVVNEASCKDYNASILSEENNRSNHEGFHRLFEEKSKLLLLNQQRDEVIHGADENPLACDLEIDASVAQDDHSDTDKPDPVNGEGKVNGVETDNIMQAFSVLALAYAYERLVESSSVVLWKTVCCVLMYIFTVGLPTSLFAKGRRLLIATDTDKQEPDSNTTPGEKDRIAELISKSITPNGRTLVSVTSSRIETELRRSSFFGATSENLEPYQKNQLEPIRSPSSSSDTSRHKRWAVSAPHVDLSGDWTLIVNDDFKGEYDEYLRLLGINAFIRRIACSVISKTTEVTRQTDSGRTLYINGSNPKGNWERVLIASGRPDICTHEETDYVHLRLPIKTADAEDVEAEAWWEDDRTKHRSWLIGGKKYGGGDFESLRYLSENGNVLVCESTFHPSDATKQKAQVTWRFRRDCAD
ncbi:hypothetical protein THAOC_02040 [Thalassiosira oceanica]|uniref:PH domain-containing protein n=1 Tax=Thalassiosira oceanica TaxID=159749 RepID=K0TQK7_THAOC|nr:hypothetical protein THAOC_02040 [Thalassiosira oceanica]|eukprot:EJK76217.1 hypothetical protein THAOC_02040 [Thalassiosira oceanica]